MGRKYFLKALNLTFLSKGLTLTIAVCIRIPTAPAIDGGSCRPQESARTQDESQYFKMWLLQSGTDYDQEQYGRYLFYLLESWNSALLCGRTVPRSKHKAQGKPSCVNSSKAYSVTLLVLCWCPRHGQVADRVWKERVHFLGQDCGSSPGSLKRLFP